jgi:hypothetical protein
MDFVDLQPSDMQEKAEHSSQVGSMNSISEMAKLDELLRSSEMPAMDQLLIS